MKKCLAWFLMVLTASGPTGRVAYASADHPSKEMSQLKARIDNLSPDTTIMVKLKDHSEVEGKLISRADEGFEIGSPTPMTISYSEVKSLSDDPSGQASPGSAQSSSSHHSHFARNVLIGIGVMCVVAVIFAVAAKK